MKIIWTEQSEIQLDKISHYIATNCPLYAHRWPDRFIEQAGCILRHTGKLRTVPEYEREDIREIFYHPYRVIYLIKDHDHVSEILSVIHGPRLLTNKPE